MSVPGGLEMKMSLWTAAAAAASRREGGWVSGCWVGVWQTREGREED